MNTLATQDYKKKIVGTYLSVVGTGVLAAHSVSAAQLATPRWFLFCPLHAATGVRCPTCGLGRSLYHAFLGNWSQSWMYHPGGITLLSLGGLFCLSVLIVSRQTLVHGVGRLQRLLQERQMRVLLAVMLVLYVIWGALRSFPEA